MGKGFMIFLQARMSSTRLPGKVMMRVNGKPLLWYSTTRLKKSKKSDGLVVLTSTNQDDDIIEDFCKSNSIAYFRGNLEDVLDRYYQAAKKYNAKYIVRVTGDCPLIDWEILDEMISFFSKNKDNYDYVSNSLKPYSFPQGTDVEITSFKTLEIAWREAESSYDREHVMPYIVNSGKFRVFRYYFAKGNYSNYRLCVDYKEDFETIKGIIEQGCGMCTTMEIIDLLKENPSLVKNEMYLRS